jgi:O-antigen/teichoic acid export membrane protein
MINISKQLFRNSIFGWFEIAVLFATAMIVPPLLLTRLGKDGYGVWALVGQTISYLIILDLGIGNSIGRFVAKYNAKEDSLSLSHIISSALFLFLISSFFIIIATLLIYPQFSKFFHLSEGYFNIGKWLILLSGFGVALSMPLRIGVGMLQGIHRFDLIYLTRTLRSLLTVLLILLFFGWLQSNSLLLLATITITTTIASNLLMCGIAYKNLANAVQVKRKYIKLSKITEIWSLSFSAVLITIATLFLRQGQVLCVGRIIEPEAVTLYFIPLTLLTFGSRAISSIVGAFQPMASHVQALNDTQTLARLNITGVKISATISFFIATLAIVFGYSFFRIWLPEKSLSTQDFNILSNVLTIMALGFAIGMPQTITDKMLTGIDRHWFVAVVSLMTSLIGLVIGILLMTGTTLGLYGMAIGWVMVFLIKGVLIFPACACRHLKINPYPYIQQAYLPPLAVTAILIVAAYSIRHVFGAISIVSLILSIISCLVVYAIAVYFICLDNNHKTIVRNRIATIRTSLFRN